LSPQARADSVSPIKDLINKLSIEQGVPPAFARAMIASESQYKPKAKRRNNYGLGQISCGTAHRIGFAGDCKRLFDVETNLHYSIAYMKQALVLANDNLCHAATLYNHGLDTKKTTSLLCKKVMRKMG
jgi:soluble lytic murein transglycosylase-like protein